jgi:hypothetical protein
MATAEAWQISAQGRLSGPMSLARPLGQLQQVASHLGAYAEAGWLSGHAACRTVVGCRESREDEVRK